LLIETTLAGFRDRFGSSAVKREPFSSGAARACVFRSSLIEEKVYRAPTRYQVSI
jgi:hypothetical protein